MHSLPERVAVVGFVAEKFPDDFGQTHGCLAVGAVGLLSLVFPATSGDTDRLFRGPFPPPARGAL